MDEQQLHCYTAMLLLRNILRLCTKIYTAAAFATAFTTDDEYSMLCIVMPISLYFIVQTYKPYNYLQAPWESQ